MRQAYQDMTEIYEKARARAQWWPEEVRAYHREGNVLPLESQGLTYPPRVGNRFWQGLAIAIPLGLIMWVLLMLGVAVIGAALGLWSHPGEWFQ